MDTWPATRRRLRKSGRQRVRVQRWRTLGAAVVMSTACLIGIPRAQAQTAPRLEVSGLVGATTVVDDEGGLGRGAGVGAAVQWRVSDRWWIGGEVLRTTFDRDAALHWTGEPVLVMARGQYDFRRRSIRPYLGAALGLMHLTGRTILRSTGSPGTPVVEEIIDYQTTGTAFGIDAGIAVSVGAHVILRPHVALTISRPDRPRGSPEPPFSIWRVGGAIGWTR